MVTVVDLSALEIEIQVPESFADEIVIGTDAEVTYEGETFPGTVTSISPEVEGSRVRGRVAFDAARSTRAEAEPTSPGKTAHWIPRVDVLKVPRGPFLEAGGGRQAYVIDDGIAVLRPIQVGADQPGGGRDRLGTRARENNSSFPTLPDSRAPRGCSCAAEDRSIPPYSRETRP